VERTVSSGSITTEQFEALFDTHHRALHAYCLRRLPVEDANEAASEIFLIAFRRSEQIPGGDEALPWLYGVARNVVRNWKRSGRRSLRLTARTGALASSPPDGPDAVVIRSEEHLEVLAAINSLRSADQELVRLKIWEDLPNDSVARILGITPRAVEGRYTRAIRKLSKALNGGQYAATSGPFSAEKGEATL